MQITSGNLGNTAHAWRLGDGRALSLVRARVMAILNMTPDSFSDGGAHTTADDAASTAERMIRDGADLIDIGGESTRPGAERVPANEQMHRIVPAIRAIRARVGPSVYITVDTTLSEVAAAAIDAGADGINDVSAGLEDDEMLRLAAESGAGIVLMHRSAPPQNDVYSHAHASEPRFDGGVVECVKRFLAERAAAAIACGVPRDAIVLDPGLGFGKSVAQNLELIRHTGQFAALGFPVLSGLSRKSFTAAAAGMPISAPLRDRLAPTLALSVAHLAAGASIFRVHDVREHAHALRAAESVSAMVSGLPG